MSIKRVSYTTPTKCRSSERHLTNLFNMDDKEYNNIPRVLNLIDRLRDNETQLRKYIEIDK